MVVGLVLSKSPASQNPSTMPPGGIHIAVLDWLDQTTTGIRPQFRLQFYITTIRSFIRKNTLSIKIISEMDIEFKRFSSQVSIQALLI